MKKISLTCTLLVIVGCSHSSLQNRAPSSTVTAFKEGLDPLFEKPWKGQIDAENKSLQDLGKVIGDFVAEQAKSHRAWRDESTLLESKVDRTLSKNQPERKMSLRLALRDLPNSKGLATRDAHRRPQACVVGTLKIDPNIASENQKGLFLPGAKYDTIIRFSNGNPRNLPDVEPDA